MVPPYAAEGAAQPGDEFAGADALAKAERGGAGVDPADDPVLVGRARVADAGAGRRDRRGGDAARVERRQARHAGLVHADPGVVVEGAAHVVFERGLRPAAEQPAMRAGDDDRVPVLGQDERGGVERPDRRRFGDQQKRRFQRFRRRAVAPVAPVAAAAAASRHDWPGLTAERRGQRVRMGDDAARHHVGAVADPRRVVADRRGGDAEVLQVVEPADPGAVAADAGVVEDRRGGVRAWPRDRRHRRRHARR